jgi:hypothetical protein
MPHVERLPLSKLTKNAQFNQSQIEFVLLLPAIEHCVLDLFFFAKVADSIVANGKVLVFAAIYIVNNSINLQKNFFNDIPEKKTADYGHIYLTL